MSEGDRRDREPLDADFLSEAESIFEALADRLRALEDPHGTAEQAPAILNAIFRDVHSLKGLSALQGEGPVAGLAHALEEHLQRLRMSAARPTSGEIDLIHEAYESLTAMTRLIAQGAEPLPAAELGQRLREGGAAGPAQAEPGALPLPLDPRVRASLSEYEERRLQLLASQGGALTLVRLRLDPEAFDARLRAVVRCLEERSEVIATVPLFGDDAAGMLFEILVTGRWDRAAIETAAGVTAVETETLQKGDTSRRPAAPESSEGQADDIRGVSETIRVSVARLDELLTQVGDMSIALLGLERTARRIGEIHPGDRDVRELVRQIRVLQPRLRGLHRGTIAVRLVPLQQVFGRAGRMVARAARAAGKEVEFHTLGGETELDKAMMDQLASPLVHLLRNALDHGLEPPDERQRAAKPRRGRLVLTAVPRGRMVTIEINDDGRGIDVEAVRAAAVAAGLLEAGRAITPAEAGELIFAEGFSTSGQVSQSSGRGVGLSVVRRAIRRIKGSIDVHSVPGRGTTFIITMPITMALVPALIVKAAGQRFAIPMTSVREHVRIDRDRLHVGANGATYEQPGGVMPMLRLAGVVPAGSTPPTGEERFAVIAGTANHAFGILVDGFIGHQEVVIKPVGRRLRDLPGIAGATDLGDATAVLVIEPEGLLARSEGGHAPR